MAQNNEVALNTDNSQLGNNPGNVINLINNPDVNISNQQANIQVNNVNYINDNNPIQVQQQGAIQINNNRNSVKTTSISSGSNSNKTKTYTTYSSPAKKHTLKLDLKLGKVHFMRKFFNESAVFKAKTYKKIFSSKKKRIKKCFKF